MQDLIVQRPEGLYCPPGDFFIDPWRPVDRAVITHAHADHARSGHGHYLAASQAEGVLRSRLGQGISLQTLDYGQQITHHGVTLSLHPAGHVLGSAQVRLEYRGVGGGQTWVASGDYKVAPDATCTPFEPVRCDVFITESTFGLPIYRWRPDAELFAGINAWWAANAAAGRASVLMCYSFGKAQRILSGVDASIAPIIVHGAVQALNSAYRAAGVELPATRTVEEVSDPADFRRALVLCPPGAAGMRRAGPPQASTAPSGGSVVREATSVGVSPGAGPPQASTAPYPEEWGSEAHGVASVGVSPADGPPLGGTAPSGGSAVREATSVGVNSGSWIKRFGDFSDAFASGWMQLRGARRRGAYDRGFVLSDHADWPGLMSAISATGAERVIVTHGSVPVMVRYLAEQGLQAGSFDTEYGDAPVEEQMQTAAQAPTTAQTGP